jgi:hypothetical protein
MSWLRTPKWLCPIPVLSLAVLCSHPGLAQEDVLAPRVPSKRPATVRSASAAGAMSAPSEAVRQQIVSNYARLPLSFEANRGQSDAQVKFLSRGRGYTLFLTSTEAMLALQKDREPAGTPSLLPTEPALSVPAFPPLQSTGLLRKSAGAEEPSYTTLQIRLVGANPATQAEGLVALPGKSNYFIGNDPKQWRTDVPTYGRVKFHDVYPGVDLVYYGNQQQLEHDFIVAPGTDPATITLNFDGAKKVSVDSDGGLPVTTQEGEVLLKKPVVYQEQDGQRSEIPGKCKLNAKNLIGFEVASHDATRPLVIDPILVYASYLGGSSPLGRLCRENHRGDSGGRRHQAG